MDRMQNSSMVGRRGGAAHAKSRGQAMASKMLLALGMLLIGPAWGQPSTENQATIYVSPQGTESADGASAKAPMATLQKAVDRAAQQLAGSTVKVRILVGKGRYSRQLAVLTPPPAGKSLEIRADCPPSDDCAVFDGGGEGRWLTIKPSGAAGGSVTVSGLTVTDYLSAIATMGARNDAKASFSGIAIVGNNFRRIGQFSPESKNPSTGALIFINTSDSRIEENTFQNIRNRQKCGLIHAIYLAHHSTGNTVRGNKFEGGCGDAIRLRDGSSNNIISDNSFSDFWAFAPISDWYCDASSREDCTKESGECPSFGNVLSQNRVAHHQLTPVEMSKTFGADEAKNCAHGPTPKRFVER